MTNVVPLRVARQAALDDPADLVMARDRYARHLPLPLSATVEIALRKIQIHESEIATHMERIRWLRLEIESG